MLQVATVFIACVEGGVMLAHLNRDASAMRALRQHLADHIERELRHAGTHEGERS